MEGLDWPFGKKYPPPPYKGIEESRPCFKKKLIFFELEYWKDIPIRHCLDVMHIEKNVCDSIIGTLLNIPGKTKDGVATHLDIVDMGIRTGLKPIIGAKRDKLERASRREENSLQFFFSHDSSCAFFIKCKESCFYG